LFNIISDVVMAAHKEEKMARMETAEILAFKASKEQLNDDKKNIDESDEMPPPTTTDSESGELLIKGNPLKTIKENLCPRCHLPSRDPLVNDETQEKRYCVKSTYTSLPGHDIYGRSLTKAPSKNPRKASKASLTDTQQPKAMSLPPVPNSECPNCSQKLTVSQMARHLDRCMRSSNRQGGQSARTRGGDKSKSPAATTTNPVKASKRVPSSSKKAAPKKTAAADTKSIKNAASAGKGLKGGAPEGTKRKEMEEDQDDEEYEEPGPRAKRSRKLVQKKNLG